MDRRKLIAAVMGGNWKPSNITASFRFMLDASLITGLADGDVCASFTDLWTANPATAATTARPTYKTGILGSRPVLRFDGSANKMTLTTPTSGEWTFGVVARRIAGVDNNQRFAAHGAFGSIVNDGAILIYDDIKGIGYYGNQAFGQVHLGFDCNAWFCSIATYTDAEAKVYIDNVLVSTFDPADFVSSNTTFYVGGLAADNFINGDIALVFAFNKVLTAAERNNLSAWIKNYMAMKKIVFDGDSLTDETYTTYPAAVLATLGNNYTKSNYAISGQTIATVNTNKAIVTGVYSAYRRDNIVVIWAGTNDITAMTASATVLSTLWAYCTTMKSTGYKVVVLNVLARGDWNGAQQTIRTEVNTGIAANWATYANAFVDVTADARLQNPADGTYFNADTVHLIEAGWNIVAALVATSIQGL